MQEHRNVQTVRRLHDALAAGDFSTAQDLFSEEAVWHLPGQGPLAGDHIGWGRIRDAMRWFDEAAGGTLKITVHDVLGSDEHAVALLHTSAAREGKNYDIREMDVYHFGEGKISEFWSFSEDQRATDEFWSG
jgi:ketosteroid isomerase-like protein